MHYHNADCDEIASFRGMGRGRMSICADRSGFTFIINGQSLTISDGEGAEAAAAILNSGLVGIATGSP